MGCCVSSHEKRATQSQKQSSEQFLCISKSPPRPEEESVKEVLSETPNPKPKPKSTPTPTLDLDPTPEFKIPKNVIPETEYQEVEVVVEEEGPTKPKIPLTPKKTRPGTQAGTSDPTPVAPACAMPEEISDLSEMCSMSESVSTNTLRDRDEDELHVQQQWSKNNSQRGRGGYRSQGQNGHFTQTNRAFSAGRSPLKRVDPSPPRRRNPVQGSARRERGENSGRRSGSPGSRANVGRSPSGRRAGPSPGRVRIVQGPTETESESDERKVEERETENEWQGPNESLENPLVSLECFIFL